MPQVKPKGEVLSDFDFDNEETFFNIPGTEAPENQTSKALKEIKSEKIGATGQQGTDLKEVKTQSEQDQNEDEDTESIFSDWEDPEEEIKPVKKEVKKAKVAPKKVEAEAEEESEEEEEAGAEDSEEDEEGAEAGKEEDEDDEEEDYSEIAEDLKEVLTIDLKKGQKLSREKFVAKIEDEIETRTTETLESFFEGFDDDTKEFIRFKKAGGTVQEFLAVRGNTLGIDDLDVENERHVSATIAHYIKTVEGLTDEDEIEDRIRYYKDGGKEKATAKKFFDKIKANEKKIKEEILEAQEDAAKEKVEGTKAFYSSIKDSIKEADEVGVFSLSRDDKKKLEDFLIKPTVKAGKNNYIQPFQLALGKILQPKTKKDKENLIQLGLILMNDFNLEALTVKAKTKVVKEVRKVVERSKAGVKVKGTTGGSKRNLSDFFPDE